MCTINKNEYANSEKIKYSRSYYCPKCNKLEPIEFFHDKDIIIHDACVSCRVCGSNMNKLNRNISDAYAILKKFTDISVSEMGDGVTHVSMDGSNKLVGSVGIYFYISDAEYDKLMSLDITIFDAIFRDERTCNTKIKDINGKKMILVEGIYVGNSGIPLLNTDESCCYVYNKISLICNII